MSSWILKIPHLFKKFEKSKDIFILSAAESTVKPVIFKGIIKKVMQKKADFIHGATAGVKLSK